MNKSELKLKKQFELDSFIQNLPNEEMTISDLQTAIKENFPESRTLTIDEWEAEMDIYFAELEAKNNKRMQES
jgi:hypothetical protein